jgi:F-type H+-transporting ATPase subunit a
MLGIFPHLLPVPFMFLEILVGAIQATVFAMLTLAFLVVATMEHGHSDHDEHEDDILDKDAHVELAPKPAR